MKCDQIGLFLEDFGNNFAYKSSPKYGIFNLLATFRTIIPKYCHAEGDNTVDFWYFCRGLELKKTWNLIFKEAIENNQNTEKL